MVVKPLYGHNSSETAYMVEDYPYGRNRCRIRYWLEANIASPTSKGFRFVSQTEHPVKKTWNAPKASTYKLLAGNMYLDEKGHVTWTGLSEYSSAQETLEFIKTFRGSDFSRLKALLWCERKAKLSSGLASGRVVFTINDVPQLPSEHGIAEHRSESELWQEAANLLKTM
jgi:hypothetical protein